MRSATRHGGQPVPDLAVQRRQLRPVGRRPGRDRVRVTRIGRGQRGLDRVDVLRGVGDVHPDVRVGRARPALALEVGHARQVARRGPRPAPRCRRPRPAPLSQSSRPEAVAHDQVGVRDPLDVGRRRVERVDLAALGHEAVDVDPRAADLGDEVGEDGGRGDDRERVRGRAWDPPDPPPPDCRSRPGRSRRGPRPRAHGGGRRPDEAGPHATGAAAPDARHAAHRPNSSSRCDVTVNSSRSPDRRQDVGQAEVVDVVRPAAAGADRVVVVGRLAADVRVVAGGQVDPLDEAERRRTGRARGRRSPARCRGRRPRASSTRSAAVKWPSRAGDRLGDRRGAARSAGSRRRRAPRPGPRPARHASRPPAPTPPRRDAGRACPRGPNTSASRNMPVWTSTIVAPLATSSQYER